MSDLLRASSIGTPRVRLDGPDKVRGLAPYAYEHPVEDPLHLFPLCSTIALGRVTAIDASIIPATANRREADSKTNTAASHTPQYGTDGKANEAMMPTAQNGNP